MNNALLIDVYRGLRDRTRTSNRQLENGPVYAEAVYEEQFAEAVEVALTDLYQVGIDSLDRAPDRGSEQELVAFFVNVLSVSTAAQLLLSVLMDYIAEGVNVGGQIGLDELGLDGTFELTDKTLIDQVETYAREVTAQLILTTANDLARQFYKNQQELGLPYKEILLALGGYVVLRAFIRSLWVAGYEGVWASRFGMVAVFKRNGIVEVEFRTRRDKKVDNGDPNGPCAIRDGMRFMVDNIPEEHQIPQHIGCRCWWQAIKENWVEPAVVWLGGIR